MALEPNGLTVAAVGSRQQFKQFLHLPWKIYPSDPAWIPPLLSEEKKRFDRKHNPFFEHAEAEYFVAWRNGEAVGRITAQIDELHIKIHDEKTGFFGFFECVDEPTVAKALLDKAAVWLRARGMETMRGPFSFSINEEAGLLVKGHQHPPMIMTGHHPSYYEGLLKGWGLTKIKDLYSWYYNPLEPIPEPALQIADEVRKYPGLTVREVNPKNMDRDIQIIFEVFNAAWSNNWGFVPLTSSELKQVIKDVKMIIDPSLALIAEVDGKPAAISLALPDVNRAIRDLNGRLFPLGILKLLYRLKIKRLRAVRLILLGVKKEYRGSILGGLSVLLYTEMHRRGQQRGYTTGELSWTLEDNEKINLGIQMMGGENYKTYRVFEKAL